MLGGWVTVVPAPEIETTSAVLMATLPPTAPTAKVPKLRSVVLVRAMGETMRAEALAEAVLSACAARDKVIRLDAKAKIGRAHV